MSGDDSAHAIWLMLVLVMVASSLTARRIPATRLITWSAGWVVLFLGAYLLFDFLQPSIAAWQQSRRGGQVQAIAPQTPPPTLAAPSGPTPMAGATVSVPLGDDGHYWVDATVNDQSVRFLIDSGASITALSTQTAEHLGLVTDPFNRSDIVMQTANGSVTAQRSVIPTMRVGTIEALDLPVVVSPSFGEVNVLGMNFLNKLKSWRVEDGHMILEPR